ncbi:MAG: CxxxxCH/CxxCH domain-containing protein, partial [Desulfuromonadales bacterium]|nr:CxxxxCH/CxxCH domain-containing protein [Desulfuromonadales bacterium]
HNDGSPTWDVAIGYTGGLDGTCSNIDCHYSQPSTPAWNTGSTQCDSCHGYPPAGGDVPHDVYDQNAFL